MGISKINVNSIINRLKQYFLQSQFIVRNFLSKNKIASLIGTGIMGITVPICITFYSENNITRHLIAEHVSDVRYQYVRTNIFCNQRPKELSNDAFYNGLSTINNDRNDAFNLSVSEIRSNKGLISKNVYKNAKFINEQANILFQAGLNVCNIKFVDSNVLQEYDNFVSDSINNWHIFTNI